MDELREKCPWDRKQTMLTLRTNTIEECFELTESILSGDKNGIKEELGDLLLHIVFYSKIASEENSFDFGDVVETLCEKLIYRHPHIYSTAEAETAEEVKSNWEALKQKKKKEGGLLSGVPRSMPALPKATRIGEKAAAVGFDWEKREDVWAKVEEELAEVREAIANHTIYSNGLSEGDTIYNKGQSEGDTIYNKGQAHIEEEFGDLLFAITNAARLYGVDPETALERTNKKFISRFEHLEQAAAQRGVSLHSMTLEEMEELWCEAKGK